MLPLTSSFKNVPLLKGIGLMSSCITLAAATAFAQSADDGDVIELSPFVVETSEDIGYIATSSLAGSRLRTNLGDIASQVDVFTLEFAEDVGAVSIEDLYEYSSSMENARDFTIGANGGVDAPTTSRVRGFDNATQSSDFFKTELSSDFYNLDRVTVANGPNSILFGLGLPGGIVNTQMKTASFKDSAELRLQADNWGGFRGTVNLNKEVIKDKLAVRFAALEKQAETFVPGEFDDQRRYYLTGTYRPFKGATIKAKYENIDRSVAKSTNYVVQDYVSPWFEAGKPLFDNSNGNGSIAGSDPYFAKNNSGMYFIQYGATNADEAIKWAGTARTRGPNEVPGAIDIRNFSLRNFDIYPADYDVRIRGRLNEVEGDILRLFWEQRITDNLHFELAYSNEQKDEILGGMFRAGNSVNLRGDPNMYMPDGVTPNPNVGKLYIESDPRVMERLDELEELRLTVSYELDFADLSEGWASKLGRHRFAGLLSKYNQYQVFQDHRGIVSSAGGPLTEGAFIGSRFYLDQANGISYATPFQDLSFGPWTVSENSSGQQFTSSTFDNPNGAWTAANLVDTEVDSKMIAVQSFFLKDRVNVFYGLREDDFNIRGADPASVAKQTNKLYPSMKEVQSSNDTLLDGGEQTTTLGVVVRPISWLSFHYNEANNYQVPNGKLDAYRNPLPGVSSDGSDYGFRIDFKSGNNTYAVRINRYKDSQLFLQSGLSQDLKNMAANVERTLRDPAIIESYPIEFVAPDGYFFLQDIGESENAFAGYSTKRAKGTDIIGTASIGNNLNIRLAIGEQNTLVYDRAGQFRQWVSERLPVWQDAGGLGWDSVVVDADGTRTVEEYYNDIIVPQISTLEDVDGLPRFRQRRWRANIFANYNFTDGILNNFSAGIGLRWRDKAMISALALGDQQYEKAFGPDQTYIDLAFGYKIPFNMGGKKAVWDIRLNIKNLALHDNVYPIRATEDLSEGLDYAFDVEPQFLLTNSIRF